LNQTLTNLQLYSNSNKQSFKPGQIRNFTLVQKNKSHKLSQPLQQFSTFGDFPTLKFILGMDPVTKYKSLTHLYLGEISFRLNCQTKLEPNQKRKVYITPSYHQMYQYMSNAPEDGAKFKLEPNEKNKVKITQATSKFAYRHQMHPECAKT
jgi:hypothetical protein